MPIHSALLVTIKLLSKFVLHCHSVPEAVENEVFLLHVIRPMRTKRNFFLHTLSRVGLLFVSSQLQVLAG